MPNIKKPFGMCDSFQMAFACSILMLDVIIKSLQQKQSRLGKEGGEFQQAK